MKKRGFCCTCLIVFLMLAGSVAQAADWRFPLGLSYVSGVKDVKEVFRDNLEAKGYEVDYGYDLPVGITFQPYIQLESGFGVGLGLGPVMLIHADASNDDDDAEFTNVPVNMDVRYTFMPLSNISPYVRAGGRYNIASGDYVESSSPGFFGGAGLEFWRTKVVGGGVEMSYDTSRIEFEKLVRNNGLLVSDSETVEPGGLMISLYVVF